MGRRWTVIGRNKMAQGLQTTTSTERGAAKAHTVMAYGREGGQRTVCLSRQAAAWSMDSRCGSDELRGFGLAGARVGFDG